MRWVKQLSCLTILAACTAVPVARSWAADDVTYEAPAGGLIMVNDPAITIESKDLVLSATEVKASYVLRNTARTQRAIVIAFPLPDLDMAAIGDQPIKLPAPLSDNFVAAAVSVDGVPAKIELEQRAIAIGLDVTRHLVDAGVPLFPYSRNLADAVGKLAPLVVGDLQQRGVLRTEDGRIDPNWQLKSAVTWRQVFTAGQSVTVQLTYQPMLAEAQFSADRLAQMKASHCIDAATEAEITRKVAASGGRTTFRWMTYSLTSGSQYVGEIGRFRLLVEKPNIETLVSSCRKGLRQAGPTVREASADNFHPDEDIHLVYIQ